ncbi:MAG TPA: PIN domain-containing protein [Burkholderiales bacterium]|jgi:predicted nucleic acid-binding protein
MAARNVVVDAGPIVASLVASDAHHAWTRDELSRMRPPLLTCEAALLEAAFIVQRAGGHPDAVPALVERGMLRIAFSLQDQAAHLAALMRRYATLPMSLTDACLVRMAELLDDAVVMTFDSDFRVYRKHNRRVIPLLAPEGV